jgi:hypothetical protein
VFKYPHVKDIWLAYLQQFVKRYEGTKLERARDLFKQALSQVRASLVLLPAGFLEVSSLGFGLGFGPNAGASNVIMRALFLGGIVFSARQCGIGFGA